MLVGREQNCLQWLTLRKADYKSSSNSKENFIAQGDLPVQVFPSPLYPLKQRHTYDPSVLVHRALESQSFKSSVAHSSTSTQNRGIKKQSLSHNCRKFAGEVYKGTMVLNRWGRGDGVDNDYCTLQKGWAVFQALAFVTQKQVIPGCAWLIGGERRCWHHKKRELWIKIVFLIPLISCPKRHRKMFITPFLQKNNAIEMLHPLRSTCATLSIACITSDTSADIRSFSVGTHGVLATFV